MGGRYVENPVRAIDGRFCGHTHTYIYTCTDARAVLKEIERDSASRSQKKQEKAKTPVAKAVPAAGPKTEPSPVQEPAKGRTAYFF